MKLRDHPSIYKHATHNPNVKKKNPFISLFSDLILLGERGWQCSPMSCSLKIHHRFTFGPLSGGYLSSSGACKMTSICFYAYSYNFCLALRGDEASIQKSTASHVAFKARKSICTRTETRDMLNLSQSTTSHTGGAMNACNNDTRFRLFSWGENRWGTSASKAKQGSFSFFIAKILQVLT